MEHLNLNEHHESLLVNYMQFAKYQRQQYLKSVVAPFQDILTYKLVDETYTKDEVKDLISSLRDTVSNDVENELKNLCHTNVLLIGQLCELAEKWHLELMINLSKLENKELLMGLRKMENGIKHERKLTPLSTATENSDELLRTEIERLDDVNKELLEELEKLKLEMKENNLDRLNIKKCCEEKDVIIEELTKNLETHDLTDKSQSSVNDSEKMLADYEEILKEQISAELEQMKKEVLTAQSSKILAEKELEKRFNKTAAYTNMKKMISKKNEQVKELRKRLQKYEPENENTEDDNSS